MDATHGRIHFFCPAFWLRAIIGTLEPTNPMFRSVNPMAEMKVDGLRDIVLVGHSSSGKTSLVEAMLFDAGVTTRLGKIEEGNTVSDFDPEEVRRRISISVGVLPIACKDGR